MQKNVSLELAKKLKEAGLMKDTGHTGMWYVEKEDGSTILCHSYIIVRENTYKKGSLKRKYYAWDIPELLEELPKRTNITKGEDGETYFVYILSDLGSDNEIVFKDKNLSDALAKLWLELKNNNLI